MPTQVSPTDSDDTRTEGQHGDKLWLEALKEDYNLRPMKVAKIMGEWDTERGLVNFLAAGNSVTELENIGKRTERRVMSWFADKYPDRVTQHKQGNNRYLTEITTQTKTGAVAYTYPEDTDADEYAFAFTCNRCRSECHVAATVEMSAGTRVQCDRCDWMHTLTETVITQLNE